MDAYIAGGPEKGYKAMMQFDAYVEDMNSRVDEIVTRNNDIPSATIVQIENRVHQIARTSIVL
jgi:hypothetical protein